MNAPASGLAAPCEGERLARSALSRVFEPGEPKTGALLRTGGAEALLERLRTGGAAPKGFTKGRWEALTVRARRADPERDLARAAAVGGRFVCPGDLEWPSQLDDLQDTRPLGLWVRGPADLRMWSLRAVAIVGARACTDYGTYLAGALAVGLAEQGWVVVSGGAFGIDGAAHRGALGVAGGTLAVLACGIDRSYPPGHARLLARIAEQGLLVGELPPGEHPTPSRFVTRNRVIAALTRGTVVVEAALRSGALVTARAAERLGRHVMGVPGPATSGLSAGVHQLLRGQAHLVTDAAEVVELVGEMGELAPERRGPLVPRDLLSPEAAVVLAALPAHGVVPAESIALAAVTAKDDVIARLYELQALGFVERHGDGWQLTRRTRTTASPGWERGGHAR
ncbi:DNA-processing protein DprA [Streptomyces sp. SPB074]|uniref:DNA-processing protein DprA n=1 Tax=Streptomyces sp. (strain SPB074) TaxID=465543 RepID=UPI00017F2940|nr:DNA-processing protein DprA [Streptomyces sp. SPB074]EDY44289.1 SMF protein [Streptomyces sp. SPB074]